jgi:hypothetical protein
MAFIPNIDALRGNFSSFAARGSAPSVQFLQRFGGGFQGTPFVAQQFRGEPDEGFRRAIPDSRRFANAFEDRGEEQFVAPPPTYTPPPPPEPTVSTVPESFYSNLTASQSYVQRTESDASIQNAAAALDPTRIQSILDAARNASGFTGLNGISPMMFQTRDDVVPISEPELGRNIFNYEDIGNAFTPSNDQVNEVVEPLPEPVPYDPPPVYIAPPAPPYQPEPTYSRVDEEEDDDEIESIDVVGRRRDDMDDEEIESIDVRGRARDREDLESVDVRGRTRGDERDYVNEARQQQQPVYGGDNPWETFKALYTDFMTGGKGGAVLQEFNRKEAQGELGYDYSPVLDPDSFVQAYESGVGRDTDAIMRAKIEREEYDTRAGDVSRKDQSAMAGATIINNNQTIATTRSQEMSRTNRVFGDDNTFNRLAAADSNNPRFG